MNVESEQVIAMSALMSPQNYELIAKEITEDYFFNDKCRRIYNCVKELRNSGQGCDLITVSNLLDRKEHELGSNKFHSDSEDDPTSQNFLLLQALRESAATYRSVEAYLQILKDEKASYDMDLLSSNFADLSVCGKHANYMYSQTSNIVDAVISEQQSSEFIKIPDVISETISQMDAAIESGGGISGQSSGFADLDTMLSGLNNGNLIIHAARPAMGKSAFAINIANHVSKTGLVLFYSLEMTALEIGQRSLSANSKVNLSDIRQGTLLPGQRDLLFESRLKFVNRDLLINDKTGLHVDQLVMDCRIQSRAEKPKLIVIDYLQLLQGDGQNRTQEIGYCSRKLKELAKEVGCPVYCLAQLNRAVESSNDKRPLLSHLRDSGEIEQDADIVLFTYRDELYNEYTHMKGIAELIVSKNRQGETGTVYLDWSGKTQLFTTRTDPIPVKPERQKEKMNKIMGEEPF